MKRLISAIALTLFLFLLAGCAPGSGRQIAPDFLSATIDGETFALKDRLGRQGENKAMIVAFFNTGCAACREDLRYLQEIQHEYGNDGLDVICVFAGRAGNADKAKKYMRDLGLTLPVVTDENGTIRKRYNVTGLPCQYVIDREGFVTFRSLGCSDAVKAKIEGHLRELLS